LFIYYTSVLIWT